MNIQTSSPPSSNLNNMTTLIANPLDQNLNSSSHHQNLKKKIKGRTFQCTGYPECNMTFTRSEHLARHIRKHTGERPFECVHCSRKFSRLDNLRQHKQTVHAHERIILSYVNGKPVTKKNQLQPLPEHSQHIPQTTVILPPEELSSTSYNHNLGSHSDSDLSDHNQQHSSDASSSATLLRPTQFRSKHRPRPLALPTRKTMYTDTPYTVPTPRSSSSTHFILSPISPSLHHQPLSATIQQSSNNNNSNTSSNANNLPPFQFISGPGPTQSANTSSTTISGDSLMSPYNSSFNSSSIYSSNNTPLSSTFDLKTPTSTSTSYEFMRNSTQSSNGSTNSSFYEQNRRSWLNNVLNNNELNNNGININVDQNDYLNLNENKKLKIESLLNSNKKLRPKDFGNDKLIITDNNTVNVNSNDDDDNINLIERAVKLPPVDNLGIQ